MDKPALSNLLLFSLVQHPAVFNNSFTTYFLPCFVLLLFLFFSCCRCSACNVWQLERQIAPKSLRSSCRSTFCFCLSFSPSADLIGLDCLGFRLDGRASCFIGLGLSKRLACSWLTFIDLASLCLFLSLSLSLSLSLPIFLSSFLVSSLAALNYFRHSATPESNPEGNAAASAAIFSDFSGLFTGLLLRTRNYNCIISNVLINRNRFWSQGRSLEPGPDWLME